jgi:hypothetical protein
VECLAKESRTRLVVFGVRESNLRVLPGARYRIGSDSDGRDESLPMHKGLTAI